MIYIFTDSNNIRHLGTNGGIVYGIWFTKGLQIDFFGAIWYNNTDAARYLCKECFIMFRLFGSKKKQQPERITDDVLGELFYEAPT